jgi:hypothetical protein
MSSSSTRHWSNSKCDPDRHFGGGAWRRTTLLGRLMSLSPFLRPWARVDVALGDRSVTITLCFQGRTAERRSSHPNRRHEGHRVGQSIHRAKRKPGTLKCNQICIAESGCKRVDARPIASVAGSRLRAYAGWRIHESRACQSKYADPPALRGSLALVMWTVVGVARRPNSELPSRNKAVWIVGSVVGWLLLGIVGAFVAVVYLVGPRRRINSQRR